MSNRAKKPEDFIVPLNINGLQGRMLRIPSAKKNKRREILFIGGQHTSIERIMGLAEYVSNYGNVTSPDLPGFGGMDPFYKIRQRPTIDNMADYLATFIRLRYRNRRLTIIAVSYGFAVITRMLQKYPDIAKRVDLLVSISGIVNKDDFRWKKRNIFVMKNAARLFARKTPAFLAVCIGVKSPVIKGLYKIAESKHPKLRDAAEKERKKRIDFEVGLWKNNDFRTWMETCVSMFRLDLNGRPIDLPVYHVSIDSDHYFDNSVVEEHMRKIYKDFTLIKGKGRAHVPTIIASAKDAAVFIPEPLARLLNRRVKV
jgi:pimeloyl-ACP methyl ester carboxylesterase